jgi:type I restriction enzyme, S subunit
MAGEWRPSTWGEEISLEYGKALRSYDAENGKYRVFGSNGPIGWTTQPLSPGPGVILGRKGAYRGVHYSPDSFFVIDTAYYVVPKTDLDMRWLYYAITYYKLGEVNDGSPIPSTTRAAVYVLHLEVPPLPEQRAISSILGTVDDKIELNGRMIETLEAIAQATFKSWFIDFDPMRSRPTDHSESDEDTNACIFPDRFQITELGEIPDGWSVRSVYDCATLINGVAFSKVHFSLDGSGLPIVKIAELKDGITAQTKFTNDQLAQKYRIRDGDILFSWSGSPDTSIDTFVWAGGDAWLNQHIFKVESGNGAEKLFVYYLLKHLKPTFIEIARDKQTTGLGHVTAQDLKRLKVAFPSAAVLEVFQGLVEPLFKRSLAAAKEDRPLAALRDALLPKLLSGALRVRSTNEFGNVIA